MEQSTFLGLRTVVYEVGNLEEAIGWYTQAFGIEPYFNESYYAGFNIRGFELGLMPAEDTGEQSKEYIGLLGRRGCRKRICPLTEPGRQRDAPIMDVGGGIRLGSVIDPFGNALGIIYNPISPWNSLLDHQPLIQRQAAILRLSECY